MTKKTNLKWRLGKLPSVDEVLLLMDRKLITKEDAQEILFNSETEEDRDKKSLESEIKFLRELVEKLSKGRTEIIETIRYIEKPYYHNPWWKSYEIWCGGSSVNLVSGTGSSTCIAHTAGESATLDGGVSSDQLSCHSIVGGNINSSMINSDAGDFSSIKTF